MSEKRKNTSHPVTVVGMGLGPDDLSARHLRIIAGADLLIGGRRHLECFPESTAEKHPIDKDLNALAAFIEEAMRSRQVVVLASGDPLYYGIGSYLIRRLGSENVTIHPNITTTAAAFARIKAPWHDAPVVSLHGRREEKELLKQLTTHDRIGVFTDPQSDPAWLAQYLTDHTMGDIRMWVLERLGAPDERVRRLSPEAAAKMVFRQPNFVILENPAPKAINEPLPRFGLPDREFFHENGLITKSEVRAVTLSKLRLAPHHVLWDLGAGSGAIAIEAAALITAGEIIAVERRQERVEQIAENQRRFGVAHMRIIHGEIRAVMDRLPRPHRIFIGGGGRELADIITSGAVLLESGGILVANTVLLDNLHAAIRAMEAAGLETEAVQIQVSRDKPMPYSRRFAAENPVWIVSGVKS